MTLSVDATTLLAMALLVYVSWPGRIHRSRWAGRLIMLVLLSPGLRYLSALFTFPIRLKLSEWAGILLRTAGFEVQTEGNVLVRAGVDMAVDPACMGLQMTGISLLVALFFLIWQEEKQHNSVSVWWIAPYGLVVFGLTVICNLFRIVLLVAFGAMPGTWAHELIGLACVGVYAWLSTWWLAYLLVRYLAQPEQPVNRTTWSARWALLVLLGGFGLMAYAARSNKPVRDLCHVSADWHRYVAAASADCRCKTLSNGFVQLTKPNMLVYLKPLPDWFSAEHSPLSCWQGSGYTLRRVREVTFEGHPAYLGELHRDGHVFGTTWWFSNGEHASISQLDVRGRMLRGERGYVLVNLTWMMKYPLSRL